MKTRIHFLDNLRAFMILLVIVMHACIAYTSFLENMWIVDDASKSSGIGYLVMYLDLFVMFILFFVSGYFIAQSYKKRKISQFIIAKFKRIMIPWILAVFTLIPAYKYIFLYSRGLPQEEWYTYFHFFTRTDGNMGFFADNPAQNWLWFLPVLFMFQVTYALLARTQ
jgi:fucose 4-O-acetylase-like acetyltransferase